VNDRHGPSRSAFVGGALATVALIARTEPVYAQSDALKALVAAAKAEGAVTVDGPPIDATREVITQGFLRDYGIPVSYISSGGALSSARVRAERAAGKYLLDVFLSGSDQPTLTFLPSGWLDKIEPVLVAPDVIDKRKWKDGHLWFEDPDKTILRAQQNVVPELAINTKYVKRGEITQWKQMLDPKWQGKYGAKDPATSGPGASLIAILYLQFGPDFVRKFYVDQKPALARDVRQAVQFLAQGNYAILVGPDSGNILRFQAQGYPLEFVFPTDAPSVLSGSWGLVSLLNKAPHPNAAKLFINWLAQPGPQLAYAKTTAALSLRTDLKYDGFPQFLFPQKGTKYIDTYDYKFITEQRDPAFQNARALLGE